MLPAVFPSHPTIALPKAKCLIFLAFSTVLQRIDQLHVVFFLFESTRSVVVLLTDNPDRR